MDFILPPPSLQHRTLVKIAITLWTQGDIRNWKPKSCLEQLEDSWKEVEERVTEKASKLPIPASLKEKLLVIMEPIGLEIISWIEFNRYNHNIERSTLLVWTSAVLVWTPHGTIDHRKTAKLLIKDETIDIQKRFYLACTYGLDKNILYLREKSNLHAIKSEYNLESIWYGYLKGNEKHHLYHFAIIFIYLTTHFGNEAAIRHLYNKIHPYHLEKLKVINAKRAAEGLCCNSRHFFELQRCAILCFILSTMNVEQQAEIFQQYTYKVLYSLLVWPRDSLFLEVAKNNWTYLSKQQFYDLLHNIVDRMYSKRSYLKELFLEFWQETPKDYKQFVTDRDDFGILLLKLYQREYEKIIQLILKDLSIAVKKNIIFSNAGQDICIYLVYNEKWESVEYLFQECISLSEEMVKFKYQFKKYIKEFRSEDKFVKGCQWDQFFQLIETFIIGYNKRKTMEDNNTSLKKRYKDI